MTETARFLFERSFDPEDMARRARQRAEAKARAEAEAERRRQQAAEAAAAAARPPEPSAPSYGEAELAAAREQAFAEGEASGREAATAKAEARLAEALDGLVGRLDGLVAAQRDSDRELQHEAVRLALSVVARIMPAMTARHGLEEAEAVVRACFHDMVKEPRIIVRVPDSLLDPLQQRLDRLTSETRYEGVLALLADPALGPSDCRVDWAEGGAERIVEQVWQGIEQHATRLTDGAVTAVPRPASSAAAEPPWPPLADDEPTTDGTGAGSSPEVGWESTRVDDDPADDTNARPDVSPLAPLGLASEAGSIGRPEASTAAVPALAEDPNRGDPPAWNEAIAEAGTADAEPPTDQAGAAAILELDDDAGTADAEPPTGQAGPAAILELDDDAGTAGAEPPTDQAGPAAILELDDDAGTAGAEPDAPGMDPDHLWISDPGPEEHGVEADAPAAESRLPDADTLRSVADIRKRRGGRGRSARKAASAAAQGGTPSPADPNDPS